MGRSDGASFDAAERRLAERLSGPEVKTTILIGKAKTGESSWSQKCIGLVGT
jgi:hypothetical protein